MAERMARRVVMAPLWRRLGKDFANDEEEDDREALRPLYPDSRASTLTRNAAAGNGSGSGSGGGAGAGSAHHGHIGTGGPNARSAAQARQQHIMELSLRRDRIRPQGVMEAYGPGPPAGGASDVGNAARRALIVNGRAGSPGQAALQASCCNRMREVALSPSVGVGGKNVKLVPPYAQQLHVVLHHVDEWLRLPADNKWMLVYMATGVVYEDRDAALRSPYGVSHAWRIVLGDGDNPRSETALDLAAEVAARVQDRKAARGNGTLTLLIDGFEYVSSSEQAGASASPALVLSPPPPTTKCGRNVVGHCARVRVVCLSDVRPVYVHHHGHGHDNGEAAGSGGGAITPLTYCMRRALQGRASLTYRQLLRLLPLWLMEAGYEERVLPARFSSWGDHNAVLDAAMVGG